jgi:hypothetical protein
MASVVSICNLALSNLGKQNIQSLTEASAEARACNQFYEQTRDTILQDYPWTFAGKTAAMAQVTNDKPGAWQFAYSKPNDCLKVRWIRPNYQAPPTGGVYLADTEAREITHPYTLEGSNLYCNLSPALLRYTWRLTDPTAFSGLFIDALAWHLTARLAMPLTRDPKQRADALNIAVQAVATAQEADSNQERSTSDFTSDFLKARLGFHDGFHDGAYDWRRA